MKMGAWKFATTGVVLMAAMIIGCESPPDLSPSPGQGDPYPPPGNDPQIAVLSPSLQPLLGFHPAIVTGDEVGHMFIEVPMRNLYANRYFIEYRFLFYDANGVELQPTMGWIFMALEPKQTVRLKANSMSTDSETYRLEVKWAK